MKKPRVEQLLVGRLRQQPARLGALMYVLLQKHELTPEGRENLVSMVAGEIEKNRYISTQEKLSLFLLGRSFANQQPATGRPRLTLAGKAQNIGGKGTQFQALAAGELASGVKLKNTHKERLFVELNYAGNPAKAPAARRDAFDIKREWYTADGKALGDRALKVGETLIVRLNVKTKGRYANGLVVDYVPAGVEIENANIVQGEQSSASRSPRWICARPCRTRASSTSSSATTASWSRPASKAR
jgi:uncharacterized protein YfaS (alpha-2-macroglobulin family)